MRVVSKIEVSHKSDNISHFEIFNKMKSENDDSLPRHVQFTRKINHKSINGHMFTVSNYQNQFTVKEPLHSGGCKNNTMSTVSATSLANHCFLAVNAGFFNTSSVTNDVCIGNLVSDSEIIHRSPKKKLNANFGVLKNGSIFTGYLQDIDEFPFTELVSGVIWLVRNGRSNIQASIDIEWSEAQTTGTLNQFANIISARTAIGHDSDGNIKIISVNGESNVSGLNLYDFADLLIGFGLKSAVNLDGGGSATVVWNGVVVNTPSKTVNDINVEKKLTTIICIKDVCHCKTACNDGVCNPSFCMTVCKQRTIHVIHTLLVNNFPLAISISLVACLSLTINLAFIATKIATMCKKKTEASWVPLAHLRDSDDESSYDEYTREDDQFIGS